MIIKIDLAKSQCESKYGNVFAKELKFQGCLFYVPR